MNVVILVDLCLTLVVSGLVMSVLTRQTLANNLYLGNSKVFLQFQSGINTHLLSIHLIFGMMISRTTSYNILSKSSVVQSSPRNQPLPLPRKGRILLRFK